jgi:hypothetical protein
VSAVSSLETGIADGRRRIAAGERPVYHATWSTTPDGATIDVLIRELPLIHLFVPDEAGVLDGARELVAKTLDVPPSTFEVVPG